MQHKHLHQPIATANADKYSSQLLKLLCIVGQLILSLVTDILSASSAPASPVTTCSCYTSTSTVDTPGNLCGLSSSVFFRMAYLPPFDKLPAYIPLKTFDPLEFASIVLSPASTITGSSASSDSALDVTHIGLEATSYFDMAPPEIFNPLSQATTTSSLDFDDSDFLEPAHRHNAQPTIKMLPEKLMAFLGGMQNNGLQVALTAMKKSTAVAESSLGRLQELKKEEFGRLLVEKVSEDDKIECECDFPCKPATYFNGRSPCPAL